MSNNNSYSTFKNLVKKTTASGSIEDYEKLIYFYHIDLDPRTLTDDQSTEIKSKVKELRKVFLPKIRLNQTFNSMQKKIDKHKITKEN